MLMSSLLSRLGLRAGPSPALPPAASNDNIPVMPPWADPFAVLEDVRRHLSEMRRENAASGLLLRCPRARRKFAEVNAMQDCILYWWNLACSR